VARDNRNVRINAKSDYAIRALLELAAEDGTMLTCDYIAQQQGIPNKFLGTILTDLRHAGLITSHRGAEGGYLLARPARTITVADVIRVIDGPLASVHGERPQDVEYEGNAAILQPLWIAVRASLRGVLENVTIAHLAEGQLPRKVARLTENDEAWKDH
jgi:Rrf2 family protein